MIRDTTNSQLKKSKIDATMIIEKKPTIMSGGFTMSASFKRSKKIEDDDEHDISSQSHSIIMES